ncbi:protein SSUH2 homolog [Juglans microcarpa x Juglans regia]|uniref:protein SSUH2 homolog n=1 Tax=Juglans microcarpa x Juglans regia TaxID=2249226 RepID=UPI001B7E6906|nr:protein SSUH2 homolog [Juglans microcarpa x Juglans regia]
MEEPLLSEQRSDAGEKESGKWSSYQYVGRTGSGIPTASLAGTEVSVEEIRSAAAFSDHYPPSLHSALVSSPEPDPNEQAIVYQGGYGVEFGGITNEFRKQILDEVEIRELLIDHVGHRCCWGSRPARTWRIRAVEDCNVYIGTLDTFIEERETIRETVPYVGGKIDGRDSGPELGIWELDLRSEFPVLFIPHKESRAKIPHSETIEKCSGCAGRGDIACPTCNADQEAGFYKENQVWQCPACHGRGLIAHRDGSDTICSRCNGKGKITCATCASRGLIKCEKCHGNGSLLSHNVAIVRWKTLSTRKVSATSGAASVPDEVFHRAKGIQLCNTQAYQCTPAFFADSFSLNQFSSEVIAERAPVPPSARVISERHTISVVPVTRVTMAHRARSFSFYIIGFSREVYLKDYYPSRFCWGLCPCLEWLKL